MTLLPDWAVVVEMLLKRKLLGILNEPGYGSEWKEVVAYVSPSFLSYQYINGRTRVHSFWMTARAFRHSASSMIHLLWTPVENVA